MKIFYSLEDIALIPVQRVADERGLMTVVSSRMIPFQVERIFSISSKNTIRGNHAHKDCTQFIVCLSGSLDVFVDDGSVDQKYTLTSSSEGILIPPGIWTHQEYATLDTMINVYCDEDYRESDYIRNYEYFKSYRQNLV
jgi:dTDP-4-dehydrorhamnose 3,5-epimerase-like enzyme